MSHLWLGRFSTEIKWRAESVTFRSESVTFGAELVTFRLRYPTEFTKKSTLSDSGTPENTIENTIEHQQNLWKSAALLEGFASRGVHSHPLPSRVPDTPSVIKAPEEVDSSFTLIAATDAHFQAAINAVFEPNVGAAAGAAVLPELAPHGQKEILRHIASYLEAAATQMFAGANFDSIKPERFAKGFFQLARNNTSSELLGCVTERVALTARQAICGSTQH